MPTFKVPEFLKKGAPARGGGGAGPPAGTGTRPPPFPVPDVPWVWVVKIALALLVIYAAYFWFVRRIVVDTDQVLVLLKKDGSRSLPGDQVVIPDPSKYPGGREAWQREYGNVNGILEGV